jgi:tetratricopeptide (TPR) repeat protein
MIETDSSSEQQTLIIQQSLELAVQHHNEGRLPEAESIYKQILQVDSNQPVALHLLGVIAHQVGKHDTAVDLITKAVAIKPDLAEAHNNLGNALQKLRKLDEAVASYHKALAIKPDYAEAHSNLGNALQALGEMDEAVASYHKALAIKPDYAEAHSNLGNALQGLEQLEDAVASYQNALAINPDLAETHGNLGGALLKLGKVDEAVSCFKKGLSINPDYLEANSILGTVLMVSMQEGTWQFSHVSSQEENQLIADEEMSDGFPSGNVQGVEQEDIYEDIYLDGDLHSDFTTSDFSLRESNREILCHKVSNLLKDHGIKSPYQDLVLDENAEKMATDLRDIGYSQLGRCLDDDKVSDIVSYFKNTPLFNGHIPIYSDGQPRLLGEGAESYPFGSYTLGDILNAPHLLDLVNDPLILSIAAAHLGCTPSLYALNVWWSFSQADEEPQSSQVFHRDLDDYKFCAVINYLTDVENSNGPHEYIRQTHRPDLIESLFEQKGKPRVTFAKGDQTATFDLAPSNLFVGGGHGLDPLYTDVFSDQIDVFLGKKGDAFIINPYGLHRGRILTKGRRLAFWARYGMGANAAYKSDLTKPIPAVNISAELPDDPLTRYINRLIISR